MEHDTSDIRVFFFSVPKIMVIGLYNSLQILYRVWRENFYTFITIHCNKSVKIFSPEAGIALIIQIKPTEMFPFFEDKSCSILKALYLRNCNYLLSSDAYVL